MKTNKEIIIEELILNAHKRIRSLEEFEQKYGTKLFKAEKAILHLSRRIKELEGEKYE